MAATAYKSPKTSKTGMKNLIAYSTLIILMIIGSALMTPVLLVSRNLAGNFFIALFLTFVSEIITLFIGLGLAWRKVEWRKALRLNRPKFKDIALGAGAGVGLMVLLIIISIVLKSLGVDLGSSDTSNSLGNLSGIQKVLGLYVGSVIIAPLLEELLFRGLIMSSVLKNFHASKGKVCLAIFVSAAFFALAHVQGFKTATDLFVPCWIFIVGVVNALLVLKTKSIFTSYTAHLVYNGITALLSVIILLH